MLPFFEEIQRVMDTVELFEPPLDLQEGDQIVGEATHEMQRLYSLAMAFEELGEEKAIRGKCGS